LLKALDELLEGEGQALGGDVADDDAVGHLEEDLLLALLGVGVGHVEAEVDDGLLLGGVDAVGVGVERLHVALVDQNLNLLLLTGRGSRLFLIFCHVDYLALSE